MAVRRDFNFRQRKIGVSSEILELCQDVVSIPMYGIKQSLNLACAFSVVSYLVPPYRSFSGD